MVACSPVNGRIRFGRWEIIVGIPRAHPLVDGLSGNEAALVSLPHGFLDGGAAFLLCLHVGAQCSHGHLRQRPLLPRASSSSSRFSSGSMRREMGVLMMSLP